MATASPWKDIDEKFCLCSMCLEQFKEPKLLPCLHRFCKNCLKTLLQASTGTVKCPECREEIQIPTNGVNGFKTDFYMKNLVEYVQIQQSLQNNDMRQCYSCLKHLRAAAYCFKSDNFLCADCHHVHVTNNTLKDHKQNTLSVEDIRSKNITPEKLASMRDAPRCHVHLSKVSELYCETCNNVPVCVACMLGKHKGHVLYEVTELARVKQQMLAEQLKVLEKMKAEGKIIAPSKMEETLVRNFTSEKQNLQKMYADKLQKEEVILQDIQRKLEDLNRLKKNKKQKIFDILQSEMEKEIQGVKTKYKDMYKTKENEINDEFCIRETSLQKQLAKSSKRLEQLDKDKNELMESIEMQLNEKSQVIKSILKDFGKENKRFENFNVMASNILASQNDWTAVECIPDLCTVATSLMTNLKKEFPKFETLTNLEIDYHQSIFGKPSINKFIELPPRTKVTFSYTYYYFNGATKSGDGNVVITGCLQTGKKAFIIVIDANGKMIKKKKLNAGKENPWHVCDFLSKNKVALACQPNTIGVYDICNGSYFGKIISDVINSWPVHREIKCIATDPTNNHILVGGEDSRDVYLFDDQLNYLHILTLSELIEWPRDITVIDGHVLVCDYDGKKCYVTTMEMGQSNVVREIMKPGQPRWGTNDLRPLSVCTDKDGFVYMLWSGTQCYLVQYTHDGNQILTTKEVDRNARIVTAVETAQGEKLLVATHTTQTLYSFCLLEER